MKYFKNIFLSFITSGLEGNLFSDKVRKAILINLFAIVSFAILLFYGIRTVSTSVYYLGYLYFFLCLILVGTILFLRITKRVVFVAHFIVYQLVALLLFFLIRNGWVKLDIGSYYLFPGVNWFFLFPIFTLFLLGRKTGTIVFSIITIITILYFVIPTPYSVYYDNEYVVRFLSVYFALFFFIYAFEYIREITLDSYIKSEKQNVEFNIELTNQKNNLVEKNNELAKLNNAIVQQHDELKVLNATKDKFFSIIAHDLRGPIGNYSEIIKMISDSENTFTDKHIREILEKLSISTQNTRQLLDNLLEWSLTQRKEIVYNPEIYNVNEIIDDNVNLLIISLERKNLLIEKNIDLNISAYFDKNMLNVVIRNILTNAIKYSYIGGKIIITAINKISQIEICFQDFGTGIDEKTLTNLFKIDKKNMSRNGTSGETGTGLGLILIKEFINLNNGAISIDSQLNVGTKICISLPANV